MIRRTCTVITLLSYITYLYIILFFYDIFYPPYIEGTTFFCLHSSHHVAMRSHFTYSQGHRIDIIEKHSVIVLENNFATTYKVFLYLYGKISICVFSLKQMDTTFHRLI